MTELERRFQAHPTPQPAPRWFDRGEYFVVAVLLVLLALAIAAQLGLIR